MKGIREIALTSFYPYGKNKEKIIAERILNVDKSLEEYEKEIRNKTIDECFKAIRERYDEVLQKQTKERHEKGLSAYQQPFDCFSSATIEFEILREVEKKMKEQK